MHENRVARNALSVHGPGREMIVRWRSIGYTRQKLDGSVGADSIVFADENDRSGLTFDIRTNIRGRGT